MCCGHNSAINYKQSLDRLGAARDVGGVYARNSDIAHGHHHLKLTSRTESVDHINRSMRLGGIQLFSNLFFGTLQGSGLHDHHYLLRSFEATDVFVYIVNQCCLKARTLGKLLDMLVVSEMRKARDILSVDLMVHMDDLDSFDV
jgi:hypothetical protein